jgi:hypothetical protein
MLMFTVGNLEDDTCAQIDILTADLTVVLKRNGTTISEPMTYRELGNYAFWQRWEPTAGDVYTADVTLNCDGGDTYTQSYSFTIPTPANTNCVCCDDTTPDYVTVTGLTNDCCSPINGTYALTLTSGETCEWEGEANFADPGGCTTYCTFCDTTVSGISTRFFFSPRKAKVYVGIGVDPITGGATANPDTIVTYVRMEQMWVYSLQTIFGVPTCLLYTGPDAALCLLRPEWRMESLCNGSVMTFTSSPGSGAICIGQTPAVRIYFQ